MANKSSTVNQTRGVDPAVAFVVVTIVGIGITMGALARKRSASDVRPTEDDKRAALAAYLREHLSGSDAAIQVVTRLRRTHAGTEEGRLFALLCEEFDEEREAVRQLLARLGASAQSVKRLAGAASGSLLRLAAGGAPGDLSLFRTLEGLAVGVQGKRCMWRTLQSLGVNRSAAKGRRLADFESMAVRQWAAIEERRRSLAPNTFAGLPPDANS